MKNRMQVPSLSDYILIGLLLTLFTAMNGCAGIMDKSKKLDKLELSLNDYRKSLRWGNINNAAAYIKLKNYSTPLRDQAILKNVRITSYEYNIQQLNDDQTEATVIAQISFYDVNRGSVVDMLDRQSWWLDMESKQWNLDGDLPNFRAAMR